MHNLGIFPMLGASFITTSCLESLHAMIEELVVVSMIEKLNAKTPLGRGSIDEARVRRVQGYRHLPKQRTALMKAVRIGPIIQKQSA